MTDGEEIDLARRALALRKERKIGVLWCHEHTYYISTDECDPFGTRVRVSRERLREIVDAAELAPIRRGAVSEISMELLKKKACC